MDHVLLLVSKSRREARLARAQAVQTIPAVRTALAEDAAPADDEREVLAELGVEDEPVRAVT